MSDIHLSLPQGRYANKTKPFQDFLHSWKRQKSKEDWILFVNGDYIDCAFWQKGKVVGGDEAYQMSETNLFLQTAQRYFRQVLVNFGTAHDFGNLETAEEMTGSKRMGKFKWEKVDLVWFTVVPSSFGSSPALSKQEYEKLDNLLASSSNVILMTHIPLRTKDSFEYGKWSSDLNLTIPGSDSIYSIVQKHRHRILGIFQGHIHRQYETELFDVPVFCFPFIPEESYCELTQDNRYVYLHHPAENKGTDRLKLKGKDIRT